MERIDPERAAQVWRRVLAGREEFEGAAMKQKEYSGDLPPVRTVPPGVGSLKTYSVFPEEKAKIPLKCHGSSPSPLLALIALLLVATLDTPKKPSQQRKTMQAHKEAETQPGKKPSKQEDTRQPAHNRYPANPKKAIARNAQSKACNFRSVLCKPAR